MYIDLISTLGSPLVITPIFVSLSLWSLRLYARKKKPNLVFNLYLIAATVLLGANQYINDESKPIAKVDAGTSIQAAFSPRQGVTELIIKNIEQADRSIRVAAYSFTSKPIAQALVAAQHRGVDVKVVLDRSQLKEQHSALAFLQMYEVPTRINSNYAIMHNKFMIIDGNILQTGSFNYTKAAEFKNAENVLIIREDLGTIAQYTKQWLKLWNEAQ